MCVISMRWMGQYTITILYCNRCCNATETLVDNGYGTLTRKIGSHSTTDRHKGSISTRQNVGQKAESISAWRVCFMPTNQQHSFTTCSIKSAASLSRSTFPGRKCVFKKPASLCCPAPENQPCKSLVTGMTCCDSREHFNLPPPP